MPVGLTLYKLVMFLIAPFAGAIFRRRARAGKEDASRIAERFTRTPLPRPEGRLIWMHAASVGESQILLELARRMIGDGLNNAIQSALTGAKEPAEALAEAQAAAVRLLKDYQ